MKKLTIIGLIITVLIASLATSCTPAEEAEKEVSTPASVAVEEAEEATSTPASVTVEEVEEETSTPASVTAKEAEKEVSTPASVTTEEAEEATSTPVSVTAEEAEEATSTPASVTAEEAEEEIATPATVTVVDSLGRTVTLDLPIEKIVVTEDKIGEVIRILGAEDLVVGIDPNMAEQGDMFPVMGDKTQVGNCVRGELDYELIAELDPDVVLINGHYSASGETIEPLERIGTQVIAVENFFGTGASQEGEEILDGKDIDLGANNIVHCFNTLGKILDREERAQEFLDWMTDELEMIMERTDDLEEDEILDTFLGMSFADRDLRIAGNGRKEDIPADMAGLHNILEEYGTFDVDPEYLLSHSPDIIFLTGYGSYTGGYTVTDYQSLEGIIETVSERPELKESPAVRDGRVYVIAGECLDIRPWIGAAYMGKWAYPERFEDIDPNEIAREYFEDWVRVPYEGIHFWPSP